MAAQLPPEREGGASAPAGLSHSSVWAPPHATTPSMQQAFHDPLGVYPSLCLGSSASATKFSHPHPHSVDTEQPWRESAPWGQFPAAGQHRRGWHPSRAGPGQHVWRPGSGKQVTGHNARYLSRSTVVRCSTQYVRYVWTMVPSGSSQQCLVTCVAICRGVASAKWPGGRGAGRDVSRGVSCASCDV